MKNHQRFRTFVADFTRLFETGAGGAMPDSWYHTSARRPLGGC
jgi:hypothetical protein